MTRKGLGGDLIVRKEDFIAKESRIKELEEENDILYENYEALKKENASLKLKLSKGSNAAYQQEAQEMRKTFNDTCIEKGKALGEAEMWKSMHDHYKELYEEAKQEAKELRDELRKRPVFENRNSLGQFVSEIPGEVKEDIAYILKKYRYKDDLISKVLSIGLESVSVYVGRGKPRVEEAEMLRREKAEAKKKANEGKQVKIFTVEGYTFYAHPSSVKKGVFTDSDGKKWKVKSYEEVA